MEERGDGGRYDPNEATVSRTELEALEAAALLVRLEASGVLILRGADRIDFLHGQVSNDVRGLPAVGTNRSLLLNHRGHALAQMRVFRLAEELLVLVDDGALPVVEESLRRHIIFDQVELERREDMSALTLQGAKAKEIIETALGVEVPAEGTFGTVRFEGSEVIVTPSRRSAQGGFDLLAHGELVGSLTEALAASGAVTGSEEALELGRVMARIPAAASEGGEGVLPQEAGLEPLVSYRKGCYLGQEIMARIEARGKLRRELACLMLDGQPAGGERDIRSAGKLVGRLGRTVRHPRLGYLALAVLRSDLPEDARLEVGGVGARAAPVPIESAAAANA